MTQIVLAGISTGMGVESTARSAREHSYNVIFAEDAITDVDAASQTHAFIKIFPQLGEIATTQQIIDTLEGRSVGLEVGPAAGGSITHISEGAKMPVYDAAHVPDTVGRGTLDPELEAWLPSGPTLGADVPVAQGRRDHMQLGVGPWPSVGAVGTLVLPGPHGSVTVRRHTPSAPASSPSGGLVYIHGGGFTYGTLDEFEVPMRLIAERAGIVTYIVEYQLAPEAKYPVQIEEIEYVVRWLFDNAAAQGIDPAKIGVGGDSAGGNMTCVIALKLRDENGPRLAVQVPLFPEAAFPAGTLAASENRSGLYLESNGIFEMVRNLVKNTDDVRHPYITPLNAGSHAGLPPAILVTNGFDPLRDVGHAYARKLAAAGNDLTYIHNPNLTHGFPQFTRSSTACHQATLELADLIKTKIG